MSPRYRPSDMGKHAVVAVATTALIVVIAATSALAQQPPEGLPLVWGSTCKGIGKMLDCRSFLRVSREIGQFLLEVRSPDSKTGEMVITPPPGFNFTEPVLVKVENGAPERLIQTCANAGCFVTLTERLIANMRTGNDLMITMQDANKKPIELSLTLSGFGVAFDKALGQ